MSARSRAFEFDKEKVREDRSSMCAFVIAVWAWARFARVLPRDAFREDRILMFASVSADRA